ncbi:MAG TPA: hypothetical protein VFI56_09200 [Vicinamibacterales bacterium]|nr:hypothetical protein [Vicinamibacterales bacterium]
MVLMPITIPPPKPTPADDDASVSRTWIPDDPSNLPHNWRVDYGQLEAQSTVAAAWAEKYNAVRGLIELLCLTLGFPSMFLHDELIIDTGRTNLEGPPLYDFDRDGRPREIRMKR